jgi:hypothetical protein
VQIYQFLYEMTYADAAAIWRKVGVDPSTLTPKELFTARRTLAKTYHADAGGSGETMADINAAYDVLTSAKPTSRTGSHRAGPDEDPDAAIWAHAGWSGGMQNSTRINRNDYTDMNFIKKRMWELSKHSTQEWTISGFDGYFLRNSLTVYGSPEIFDEMAKAMVDWQTKGGNPYKCRAVLVSARRSKELRLIWADGRSYARKPIVVTSDSFNDNPSNDHTFNDRLRKLIDQLDENGGPLPDQDDLGLGGAANQTERPIEVGDHVSHPKFGNGIVINTNVRRNMSRVNFDGDNRNVKSDSLRKLKRWSGGWH